MISKEGNSMLSIYGNFKTRTEFHLVRILIFVLSFKGKPLSVCVAYSGRIAVAYKSGKSFKGKFIRGNNSSADSRYFNLVVAIFECESTGGNSLLLF